ncbi:arsenite efflux transporter metallochaperone ArsD [Deferrisoma camini]|uniref:arsenite efflux transporter metallochaperone ArsD n=1 Tax=Deferrisoma camini TaxID=1035120 RepID=UPI00046CB44F|nr:arsenite efflux transporter metallochaperone ArsD [Deferrisoma camini]
MAKTLYVYDPPLCCPTGVCGPSADPVLARFAANLRWLEQQGVQVVRKNLAQEPQAFAADPRVAEVLRTEGTEGLPLVLLAEREVSRGRYPDRRALAEALGLDPAEAGPVLEMAGTGGCDPTTGCCG